MKRWIACLALMLPVLGSACDNSIKTCKKQLQQLISYRAQAMELAFGELFALPDSLAVKFVTSKDPDYQHADGRVAYDHERNLLLVPRQLVSAKVPNPLRAATYYWPFYREDELYLTEFPVIGAVDNALWSAYLQEAARSAGVSWPHADCGSVDMSKRLPCEMLLAGIAEHLTMIRSPMFNENRLDRIWPEDFQAFQRRVGRDDAEYRDVRRYGGILLVRPLINEFGVPHVLAYLAQHPFVLNERSMRIAAIRYQEQARHALRTSVDHILSATAGSKDKDHERSIAQARLRIEPSSLAATRK